MFQALVLVRNFESAAERLNFGEFTIQRVSLDFKKLREQFSSMDVNQDDWLLRKSYASPPQGQPGSSVGGIPNDVEDVLLLLRLFRTGDISFIRQAIVPPSGNALVQFPYRAMNDLNSYSPSRFEVQPHECHAWISFGSKIRASQSWKSDWFSTARRFFLSGGAKEFNPRWDDVDRIADYATALEATLVPERDYNTRRISNRAGALLGQRGADQAAVTRFIKRLYEIRSGIVHGSTLSQETRDWLLQNQAQIEARMREILVAAVDTLPARDEERRKALTHLYDLTDEDRGELVLQKFREIKSSTVRRLTAINIGKIAGR